MRTLRDWDKYLKEQEDVVKKAAKPKPLTRIPPATADHREHRTETAAPRSGAIIAVPAATSADRPAADTFRIPEIEEFVPAVSEPRPIPKADEEVSEPRPIRTVDAPQTGSVQPELFLPPKEKRTDTRARQHRPRTRRKPKPAPDKSALSPRPMQLSPSVMDFFARENDETAERYYSRGFGETRHQLVARLLDPPLTLEETARVLGVCPTTVRRYTNKGVLSHFRTAGNQRRFRLSDVVAFVESHLLTLAPESPAGPALRESEAEPPSPAKEPTIEEGPRRKARTHKAPARTTTRRPKPPEKASTRKRTAKTGKSRA